MAALPPDRARRKVTGSRSVAEDTFGTADADFIASCAEQNEDFEITDCSQSADVRRQGRSGLSG
jgi:hypothetical protein